MTTPLSDRFAVVIAAGEACDLGRAALTIAGIGYPDLDPAPSLARLDALADAVRPRVRATRDAQQAAGEIVRFVFDECGFHGNSDDYYDARNSFLNDVLERRTGIPISLAVVLIEIGARTGVPIEGVGFPGHFLVRVAGMNGPVLLDPFFGGRAIGHDELLERLRSFYAAGGGPPGANLVRELPQLLQTTGSLGILARMLANLLRLYVECDDQAHALAAVDLTLVLHPNAPEHLRTRGLLYERLDCSAAALADLRRYLEVAPDGPHAIAVRERVLHLERMPVTLH